MASAGWIKLHRKLLDWEWSTKPLTFRLFIHLLLKASFSDSQYRGEKIPAGSIITGRLKLAQECGMTEREVRTALTHLKTTNEVTIKTTKEYSIISITNWKSYQDGDQQNANERPTNDQPTTTYKESKKGRNKEEEKNYTKKEIEIPDWLPNQEWNEYLEMRIKIKKPMTEAAKKMAISELEKLKSQGQSPAEVLKQSIFNSWQGLFALKNVNQSGGVILSQSMQNLKDIHENGW